MIEAMTASFILGIVLGATHIGGGMWRTLIVIEGNWLLTWVPSIVISLTYFIGITFIVTNNIPGYIGYSIGGSSAIAYLAWKEKQKAKLKKGHEEETSE